MVARFLCALLAVALASPALAAPPSFDPPATIPVTSGFAIYKPPADCVSVVYVGLDGEEEFPLELVGGSKTAFCFLTRGLPAGKVYRFTGVAASATGEQVERLFAVRIPDGSNPPPVDPPKPPDPPVPTGGYYFMVVRSDGPASTGFLKMMADPAWDQIRAKGHKVKDFTLSDATRLGVKFPTGTMLPVVATLKEGKETSTLVRPVQPVPADPLKLLEGLP